MNAVPLLTNEADFDPRNHKSFLLPGYELESLADVPAHLVGNVNSLWHEAEDLELDYQQVFVERWLALNGGIDAKRAKLAADVAKRDEALRMVEAENRALATRTAGDDTSAAM